MKNLLNILIISIYLISSYIIIEEYKYSSIEHIIGKNYTEFVTHTIKTGSPNEVIKHIVDCAKKNDLITYKVKRKPKIKGKLDRVEIFSSGISNLQIISGRNFIDQDSPNKFISSHDQNDKNQVGVFSSFNLDSIIDIYKLEELQNRLEFPSYFFINTTDKNLVAKFKKDLENKFGIKSRICGRYPEFIGNLNVSEIFCILYFIGLLTALYSIFLRYKEFAIRKLFGVTENEIRMNNILKNLIWKHLSGFFISGAISLLYLINKVDKIALIEFFKHWRFIQLIISIISILILLIPTLFLKQIKIPLMIKNKKPVKFMQKVNYFSKFCFGIIVIVTIVNTFSTLTCIINQSKNDKLWETTINYIKASQGNVWRDEKNGWGIETNKAEKKLFQITNAKGGIYIDSNNYANSIEYLEKEYTRNNKKPPKPYKLRNIMVNNNYLQVNPIYDINSNKVNVPDNYSYNYTILVPEKYKKYEEGIKKEYKKEHDGWLPKEKQGNMNIIYVKDNQQYFTYNIIHAPLTQNMIKDPIVQIISNNNMGLNIYGCGFTHSYYIKIPDGPNGIQELKQDIIEAGAENIMIFGKNMYDQVSNIIYYRSKSIGTSIQQLIVSIITLIFLIAATCLNYLEKTKLKNMLEKIHGINFFSRHKLFYRSTVILWSTILIFVFVLECFKDLIPPFLWYYIPNKLIFMYRGGWRAEFNISTINVLLIVFAILMLDLIISSIFIKFYEKKKINTILKGE